MFPEFYGFLCGTFSLIIKESDHDTFSGKECVRFFRNEVMTHDLAKHVPDSLKVIAHFMAKGAPVSFLKKKHGTGSGK